MREAWIFWKAIVTGIIDEISDQTAYKRHLAAHGAEHSPEQWRAFSDLRWTEKSRRGRCC